MSRSFDVAVFEGNGIGPETTAPILGIMFGDILSDLGSGIWADGWPWCGLGVAPSADIGENHAVFQPCHGSASDIAVLGMANPFAMLLSAAFMQAFEGGT